MGRLWDAIARWLIARTLEADLVAWDEHGPAHIAACLADDGDL